MPVTRSTAISFLRAEGIHFEQGLGLLLVESAELERVAAEASNRTRQQRVQKALLLQLCVVASGLAAAALVPRLQNTTSRRTTNDE